MTNVKETPPRLELEEGKVYRVKASSTWRKEQDKIDLKRSNLRAGKENGSNLMKGN